MLSAEPGTTSCLYRAWKLGLLREGRRLDETPRFRALDLEPVPAEPLKRADAHIQGFWGGARGS